MELVVVLRPPPSEAGAPLGSGRMAASPLLPPWVGGRGGQSCLQTATTSLAKLIPISILILEHVKFHTLVFMATGTCGPGA